MRQYLVTWIIEVDADNAVEAAREAREIQQDPANIATVFVVKEAGKKAVTVDLAEDDYEVWARNQPESVDTIFTDET